MVVLNLHLTDKCNLFCLHCYGNYSSGNSSFLELDIAKKALRDFKLLGESLNEPSFIVLSGGEPLLHPHIFRILDYTVKHFSGVVLSTNGTCITDQIASTLSQYPRFSVQLSLEGSELLNDRIRGSGNYQMVLSAIDRLKSKNIDIGCSMTVNKQNFADMEKFLLLCKKNKIIPCFHRYIPKGGGESILKLTSDESISFYKKIIELSKKYNIQPHCSCCSLITLTKSIYPFPNECLIGTHLIVVDEKGNVLPCSYIQESLGSVQNDSLQDIFFNSEILNLFRERNFGKICSKCKYKEYCGGCRAIAETYSGDAFADDPLCPFVLQKK